MISKRTLFILGADAFKEFDFYDEFNLKRIVARRMREIQEENLYGEYANPLRSRIEGDLDSFKELAIKVAESPVKTLNQLMRNHPQETNWHYITRYFMTMVIGSRLPDYEKAFFSYYIDGIKRYDRWLQYVFLQMMDGAETPEQFINGNSVKFLLLNYDSAINYSLERALKKSYPEELVTPELINRLPIEHLLGRIPIPDDIITRPYRFVWNVADDIHFLFEANREEIKTKLRQEWEAAEQVIVLGVHLDEDMISMLPKLQDSIQRRIIIQYINSNKTKQRLLRKELRGESAHIKELIVSSDDSSYSLLWNDIEL